MAVRIYVIPFTRDKRQRKFVVRAQRLEAAVHHRQVHVRIESILLSHSAR